MEQIDGKCFAGMVASGAANLKKHVQEVNDLNVFPIPDGDTGDNMLQTVRSGVAAQPESTGSLGVTAQKLSKGMLLGARGNSGVILSQFFAGIAQKLAEEETANAAQLAEAFRQGVEAAYHSVVEPTEGTVLTVAREATEAAARADKTTVEEFLSAFLEEAVQSLKRTPDLLNVLKEAGVVDSGGAGLIYIVRGMHGFLTGEIAEDNLSVAENENRSTIDPDLFTKDSVLEFGYCTELLLRLQTVKTDPDTFDIRMLIDYLQSVGESVVCVKNDSIVKLHVHTMTPYKVLEFCQRFGEFLTVKIENMMLQHNEAEEAKAQQATRNDHKAMAVVTVASGAGICETFESFGADVVIPGGQTMNPSAEDFIRAFEQANADTIFVLPNNGNVIMAAQQAAGMYTGADVRVIPSKSIGQGYAVLSMLDLDSADADQIEQDMRQAMEHVATAEICPCVRDADMFGKQVHKGEYIGILDKMIVADDDSVVNAVLSTAEQMDLDDYSALLIVNGKDASSDEAKQISACIQEAHPLVEVYALDGLQDIYPYILIAQ